MNANADLKSEVAEESAEAQPPSTCTPATAPLLVDPAPSEQSDGPNLWSKIRGIHKRAVACMVFQIMCGLWLLLLKSRTPFRRFQQE